MVEVRRTGVRILRFLVVAAQPHRLGMMRIGAERLDFVDRTTTPAYWMGVASIAGSVHDAVVGVALVALMSLLNLAISWLLYG